MNAGYTIILIGRNNFFRSISLSRRSLLIILACFIVIAISAFGLFVHNTRVSIIEIKQNIAEEQYRDNLHKIEQLRKLVNDIKTKLHYQIFVDNKQRNFLQVASIHPDIWSMGIGGSSAKRITNLSLYNSNILEELCESIDILKGQTKLREMSIRELQTRMLQKFELWKHIPSTHPVPGAELCSGFGYRIDPIDKTVRMHEGIDLSASRGTPVYATADGVVVYADWNMGYGYTIDIDHGYGFLTRYAHLSKIQVREGEMVKRGQIIGRVGATGRAVAPHLHYEVHVAGIKVNPVEYIDFRNVVID